MQVGQRVPIASHRVFACPPLCVMTACVVHSSLVFCCLTVHECIDVFRHRSPCVSYVYVHNIDWGGGFYIWGRGFVLFVGGQLYPTCICFTNNLQIGDFPIYIFFWLTEQVGCNYPLQNLEHSTRHTWKSILFTRCLIKNTSWPQLIPTKFRKQNIYRGGAIGK